MNAERDEPGAKAPYLPEEVASQVWDILAEECGATGYWRENFLHVVTRDRLDPHDFEYRFQGALGFGGKLYIEQRRDRVTLWVTQYPEHQTPETLAMMERANARLDALALASGVGA